MKRWHWLAICAAMGVALGPVPAALAAEEGGAETVLTRVIDAPFDEAVVQLTAAITAANFRVTGENDIGSGLSQRGHREFPRYRVIHFCNLELAREGLLVDPRLGAVMPCRAAVYEHRGRVLIALATGAAVVAPLENPALIPFQRKLDEAFRRILKDVAP